MDWIERTLGCRSRLRALRALYASPRELTGRELARRAGLSHQQAHNALRELAGLGVVERRLAAPAHLFRLNRLHWMVKEVLAVVFEREKSWLRGLLDDLSGRMPGTVVSLILFGSASQDRMHAGSDIDLLALVRRPEDAAGVEEYFAGRAAEAVSRFRFPLSPLVLTVAEFRRRYAAGDGFARDVLRSGRVVKGRLLTELL